MSSFNRISDRFPYERQNAEEFISAFKRLQAEFDRLKAMAAALPDSNERFEFVQTVQVSGGNLLNDLERWIFPAFPELWPIQYEGQENA